MTWLTRLTARIGGHPSQSRRPPDRILRAADIGGGDFAEVGEQFLAYFRELADLREEDAVLEVGCGVGRMAIPLTRVITPPGRYEGFDVLAPSVRWCRDHITASHPHFRFQHLDIANSHYNPNGRVDGSAVTFPHPDASFDLVIAISVFTHLLPESAARYLHECRRVLRPEGRLFATWFFWPTTPLEPARDLFPVQRTHCRVGSETDPEAVVAFERAYVEQLSAAAGLRTVNIVEGHWSRGVHQAPFQDMAICRASA